MAACSDLAPVITILPVEKIKAVVRGSRIRIMTAEKRLGLYSALRHHWAILRKSSVHYRSAVATRFYKVGGFNWFVFGIWLDSAIATCRS